MITFILLFFMLNIRIILLYPSHVANARDGICVLCSNSLYFTLTFLSTHLVQDLSM